MKNVSYRMTERFGISSGFCCKEKREPLPCVVRTMNEEELQRYGEPESPVKMKPEEHRKNRRRTSGIMPPEIIALSERIKAIRREHGLYQRDIAEMAGVSKVTISNIEVLRRVPRQETLKKIKECLKNLGDKQ